MHLSHGPVATAIASSCARLGRLSAWLAVMALASCGGGGGSGGTDDSPSQWSMDEHTYLNGGSSSHATQVVAGKTITVYTVSTATTTGGDKANGKYSGSALSISLVGIGAGSYNVVPSAAELTRADPATHPVLVECDVGIAVTTGATAYTARSGQVRVTRDADGTYRFSSVGTLPMVKTREVLGGVDGAPETMSLTIEDAY